MMPPQQSDNQQEEQGSQSSTFSDLLQSIAAYADLFETIDNNHPEADVRHRFLGLRAAREKYVHWLVRDRERAYKKLRDEVKSGAADPGDEDRLDTFENVMLEVDRALRWHSKLLSL